MHHPFICSFSSRPRSVGRLLVRHQVSPRPSLRRNIQTTRRSPRRTSPTPLLLSLPAELFDFRKPSMLPPFRLGINIQIGSSNVYGPTGWNYENCPDAIILNSNMKTLIGIKSSWKNKCIWIPSLEHSSIHVILRRLHERNKQQKEQSSIHPSSRSSTTCVPSPS